MKRFIAKLIIIVAIALIVTLATAYFCASTASLGILVQPLPEASLRAMPVPPGTPLASAEMTRHFVQPAAAKWGWPSSMYESWSWRDTGYESVVYAATPYDAWYGPKIVYMKAGWPLHCVDGACAVGVFPLGSKVIGNRWVPVTPRWPELSLNVAIFAAAIWVLQFLSTQTVRIAKRLQFYGPGLCKSCGYDLRGAAHARCPECGTVNAH